MRIRQSTTSSSRQGCSSSSPPLSSGASRRGLPRAGRRALALVWAIGAFAMLKRDSSVTTGTPRRSSSPPRSLGPTLARGGSARIAGAGIAVVASIWALAAFGVHASALFHVHGSTRRNGGRAEARGERLGSQRDALGCARDDAPQPRDCPRTFFAICARTRSTCSRRRPPQPGRSGSTGGPSPTSRATPFSRRRSIASTPTSSRPRALPSEFSG